MKNLNRVLIIVLGAFISFIFCSQTQISAMCSLLEGASYKACVAAVDQYEDGSDLPFFMNSTGFYSDDFFMYPSLSSDGPLLETGIDNILVGQTSNHGVGGFQIEPKKSGLSNGYFMHYQGENIPHILRIWTGVCDIRSVNKGCTQEVLATVLFTISGSYNRAEIDMFLHQLDYITQEKTGIRSNTQSAYFMNYVAPTNARMMNTITIQEVDGDKPIRMSFLHGVMHPNPLEDKSFNDYFYQIDKEVYDKYSTAYVSRSLPRSDNFQTLMIGLSKENMTSMKFEFIEITDEKMITRADFTDYDSTFVNLVIAPIIDEDNSVIVGPDLIGMNKHMVEFAAHDLNIDFDWNVLANEIVNASFFKQLPDRSLISSLIDEELILGAYLFTVSQLLTIGIKVRNLYDFDTDTYAAILESTGRLMYNMDTIIEHVIELWDKGQFTIEDLLETKIDDNYIYIVNIDTKATTFFLKPKNESIVLNFVPFLRRDYSGIGRYYSLSTDNYFTAPTLPIFSASGESDVWSTSRTITFTILDPETGKAATTPYISTVTIKKMNSGTLLNISENIATVNYSKSVKVDTLMIGNDGCNYAFVSVNVYVDVTNPTLSTNGSSTTWSNSARTITLTGTDTHSGVAAYYCNGSWVSSTASSYSCTFSSSTKTATVGVKDVVGKQTTTTVDVYVDVTNPTLSSSGSSTTWTTSNRTITLTGTDSYSGVAAYYCNGSWVASTASSYSCKFTSTTKTATVGVKDVVGKSKTSTVNVYVDKTAPTASIVTTFDSSYIDLANGKVSIPLTPGDAHSGSPTVTSTNSGTFASNKLTFPISSISSEKLTFTYTVTDKVGNTKTGEHTISVNVEYDSSLSQQIKNISSLLANKVLTSINDGKQLKRTFDSTETGAINKLSNLTAFGITIDVKYIFATQKTSTTDYLSFEPIAKPTTLAKITNGLTSPLGLKGSVILIIIFEDVATKIGNGSIAAASATALATTFDTYSSEEVTYLGAGLGEDGTIVSFSDDATSSMAVTLGASNMIEKRDVYGVLEWERAITSSGKIELKKVINNEYGILVLGETTSGSINGTSYPLKGGKDILVIRLDKAGNILFTNVLGSEGVDNIVAADMSEDKISLLVRNEEYTALHTMKLDGSDAKENIIAGNGIYPSDVSLLGNKTVVIGSIESEAMVIEEEVVTSPKSTYVQLFVDEQLQWTRMLRADSDVTFSSLDLDENNIYVLGHTTSAVVHDDLGATKFLDTYGEEDSIIVKYDYESNMDQISVVGGEGNDKFNQLLVTDSEVIVAGTTTSTEVTASHILNTYFHINKLGDTDTLIIKLDKELIIIDGLNLSYEEGVELQEIGINQYTEQLMILSSDGVHTQKVVKNTLDFEVVYEDGILKVNANEEIASAIVYDGERYMEVGEGIELPYGAYEVKVTSTSGQTLTKAIGFSSPKVEHSILPMIALFASVLTLGVLTILVIRKYRKELVQA